MLPIILLLCLINPAICCERDAQKKISPISMHEYQKRVYEENYDPLDEVDDREDCSSTSSSDAFADIWESTDYTPSEIDPRIDEIEKEIVDGVAIFLKNNPSEKPTISKIYFEQKENSASYIACMIAHHYAQKGQVEWADYFYDLSAKGFDIYADNHMYLAKRDLHLHEFSNEITTRKLEKPTASLFQNLLKIIAACEQLKTFGDPNDECVACAYALPDFITLRNTIVRWHINQHHLCADTLYGHDQLKHKVYSHGFVDYVLERSMFLKPLRKATRYDDSTTNQNLLTHLQLLGFVGVYQGTYEHNWVHPCGWVVRVKISSHTTQYTIGLPFYNPIIWDNSNNPISLRLDYDGKATIFNELNEICKLALEGNTPFVVPSFVKDTGSPPINRTLDCENYAAISNCAGDLYPRELCSRS